MDELPEYSVRLPEVRGLSQREEYCIIRSSGNEREIRLHDYDELYAIPGLYELAYFRILGGQGPTILSTLLSGAMRATGDSPERHRVLEIGAGNGVGAERLRAQGFRVIYGLDKLPSARQAAERDRPQLYQRYFVADAANLPREVVGDLERLAPTCLACVSALGPGHIPTRALGNLIRTFPSICWISMSLREDLVDGEDGLMTLGDARMIRIHIRERYVNRQTIDGSHIHDVCVVATVARS